MASAPPTVHPLGPAVEVLLRGGVGVAAVDEQEPQRSSPGAGDHCGLADHGDDVVVQLGGVQGVPQRRQRVEQSGHRVDHRRVVVLPAGLVFLGAVVVIDGVEHAAGLLGGGAEHHRRLAAVGADLDADAVTQMAHRRVVERAALVGRHESGDLLGEPEQACGGGRQIGLGAAHSGQLTVAGRWVL